MRVQSLRRASQGTRLLGGELPPPVPSSRSWALQEAEVPRETQRGTGPIPLWHTLVLSAHWVWSVVLLTGCVTGGKVLERALEVGQTLSERLS